MTLQEIEKHNITDNLSHVIFINQNNDGLVARIVYKNKFIVEKSYRNNMFGLDQMMRFRESLNNEDAVRQYLGIKEK